MKSQLNGKQLADIKAEEHHCYREDPPTPPPTPSIQPNGPSLTSQFVLSFSAIKNINKLLQYDARFGVVDTIRLVLTWFVYTVQAFIFTIGMSFHMLRSIAHTVPGEADQGQYWFMHAPSTMIDGFMFTL